MHNFGCYNFVGNCTSGEEDVITNLQSSHSASTNQSAGGQLDSADQLADSNHAAEELLDTQGYQDQVTRNIVISYCS